MAENAEASHSFRTSCPARPALADVTNTNDVEGCSPSSATGTANPAAVLGSFAGVAVGGTPTRLVNENNDLRGKLKKVQVENAALCKTMYHSSLFDAASTCGLVKRRGAPVTKPSKQACRRKVAAETVLAMSVMVQGPELGQNLIELVKVAVERDPTVTTQLGKAELLPAVMEEVADNRYKDGVRTQQKKICSKRNGWLWQAMTTTKNQAILATRTLMGRQVIDDPKCLQTWASVQPELPSLEYVHDGSSAIWVPPVELFDKVLSNPKIADTIHTNKPYDKLGDTIAFCLLVKPRLVLVC
jgi:hypothetical protein